LVFGRHHSWETLDPYRDCPTGEAWMRAALALGSFDRVV
jgi:hypothetical protein